MRSLLLLAAFLPACHLSHAIDERDAGVVILDGAPADAPSPAIDTPPTRPDTSPDPEGVHCGPNVCRGAEICCDDRCGICAFDGECPTFECPGG